MEIKDRIKNLNTEVIDLNSDYWKLDKKVTEYILSIGCDPNKRFMEYEKEDRFKISAYLEEIGILRIDSEVWSKEKELINAVEAYLKLECYESYQRNKLEEVFKKTREDEETRLKILKIIAKFIF